MELSKKYDPIEVEPRIQKFWDKNKIFKFDINNTKKVFSIDTPPPTVSGKMHLGHAFSNSQQDFIARFKRMNGFNVLQPFGTDDNGLPTKLLIEKLKHVKSSSMSRKEFRKLVIDTLNNELKPEYLKDWKRLGISCDFDIKYSTIDNHCQKISQKSFIELYEQGREYRKEAPAMYCPKCKTAISQFECEDKIIDSYFNSIVFESEGEKLIIATTRPELLPACVALFYNPDDERYKHLKGKKAKVPLFDFEVPILEDKKADPEKGTGLVMCCTFGDQTDMEWQKAHNLPIKEAIGKNGLMTSLAKDYEGLKITEAREKIIQDLKDKGLLTEQKKIKHAVNVHERCGTPIEFIHSKQWFIKYLDLKDKFLELGKEFKWHPEYMKNRYDNWVKGLQWDWCISRQINYGIPFPVWYCKNCGEVILADKNNLPVDPVEDKPPVSVCPKCGSTEFEPERDIINTWATSSLTPTIVKELLKNSEVYPELINKPMDLRPQAHDIITFWLFNTVVKSYLHYNMVPWKNAMISGWMLDPKGKKMSKSKGNIIAPQDIIKKYGADALRYMSASCTLGEDLAFPEKDIITGKKTVIKLWNASRFVIGNIGSKPDSIQFSELNPIDKWLFFRLNEVIDLSTQYFNEFKYFKAKQVIDNFFWNVFCDYYLEFSKDYFFNPDDYSDKEILSTRFTLYSVLFDIIKLFAPFIPFVTEEIYLNYFVKFEKYKSVHLASWPKHYNFDFNDFKDLGNVAVEIIAKIRKFKSENKLSLKHELDKIEVHYSNIDKLNLIKKLIQRTGKIKNIEFKESNELLIIFS